MEGNISVGFLNEPGSRHCVCVGVSIFLLPDFLFREKALFSTAIPGHAVRHFHVVVSAVNCLSSIYFFHIVLLDFHFELGYEYILNV